MSGGLGMTTSRMGSGSKRPRALCTVTRHVDMSGDVGFGEQVEPIDGLASAVAQVEAVPRQSNEQIGAGVAGGAHAVGLGITAVGDGDVARFDAHCDPAFRLRRAG